MSEQKLLYYPIRATFPDAGPGVFRCLRCYYVLLITLGGLWATTGCSNAVEKDEQVYIAADTIVTSVKTGLAEIRPFAYFIKTNGKVKSSHEQTLFAELSGKIISCNAGPGKLFSANSTILQLETTPIEFRLERARLAEFNTSKEYESQLLGYEILLKDKTKEQADGIRQKLRISSGLALAQQDIREANYDLSKAVVKAPFSGILADIKVQAGKQVKQGDELFKIYDPANLTVETKILEADVASISQKTRAEIIPLADPGRTLQAIAEEVNPYVDENGMVTVRFKLVSPRSDKLLFPGMNCNIHITIPTVNTLLVPKDAIVVRNGKTVVFTIENGKARWNYVVTGRENDKETEILEGLSANQKVIISNNIQLADEARVIENNDAD